MLVASARPVAKNAHTHTPKKRARAHTHRGAAYVKFERDARALALLLHLLLRHAREFCKVEDVCNALRRENRSAYVHARGVHPQQIDFAR